MKRAGVAALLALAVLAAPSVAAEPRQTPSELLDEAGQKLVQALKMMLMAIPQYAAPEVNDNGDIIIRRIRPKDEPNKDEAPTAPAEPGNPVQTRA